MCCFSSRVERVSGTRIFARAEGQRQLVVYEMSLLAQGELAMVLPIPVALGAGEDAVEMVDLSAAPHFFRQLDMAFETELSLAAPSRLAPQPAALKVHQVGDFEASFVPHAVDFDRLDPRFAIPSAVWASIPEVAGFGFVVFKLREAAPEPGLLDRLLGRQAPREERRYHPMAFWFPRRDASRLFFPTLHIHDGAAHPEADFDHTLYAQASEAPDGWDRSEAPLRSRVWGAAQLHVADAPGHRLSVRGVRPNRDTWIAA